MNGEKLAKIDTEVIRIIRISDLEILEPNTITNLYK